MNHDVASTQQQTMSDAVQRNASSLSLLSPPDRGWQPMRLPELASNGFPFSPTFILPKVVQAATPTAPAAEPALPFGFHYWQRNAIRNRPVIDLSKGYYDPHTQTYTIPLQAGGDLSLIHI